ncbi:MAG: ABC transporter permease [Lactobacillus sp.]|nr:ABC transporter permease [Lactobacillus sp.]
MATLPTMLKKELLETWRTYRFLILAVVVLIFALMSPLIAKLTPDIMKMSFGKTLQLAIPKPTSIDSWTQFYKNMTQMGIFVVAILFGGTMSQELSRGTLVNLVTKGLPRWVVAVSKYISLVVQWSVALTASFLVTWGYTAYYFPDAKTPYIWQGFVPLLLFGFFFLAVILFGSTLANNSYGGLLFTILVVGGLYLVNLFKAAQNYNPISLIGNNMALVQGHKTLGELGPGIAIAIGAGLVLLAGTVILLNRKKL